MLGKGAIYWAAALGAVAAVAAGGAIWRYSNSVPQVGGPAPMVDAAPAASNPSPQSAEAKPPAAATGAPAAAPQAATPPVVATLPPKPSPPPAQAEPAPPQFDIVRVEPTGEAVIAGHSAPRAKISITDRGQVVAEADADEAGQFVILPPPFAPGGHALGLMARVGDGAPVSSPNVVGIDVPQPNVKPPSGAPAGVASVAKQNPPAKEASAASAKTSSEPAGSAPTQASRTAEAAAQPAKAPAEATPAKPAEPMVIARNDVLAPAGGPTPRVAVTGVAADEAGRMVATGAAPPGAFLRLYLNGSFLASVTAGADGFWSLTVERGMRGGTYSIRADEIDRAKDYVISRAEVPFNYPEHIAELVPGAKPSPPAPAAAPPATSPAAAPPAAAPPVAAPAVASPAVAAAPVPAPPAASPAAAAPRISPPPAAEPVSPPAVAQAPVAAASEPQKTAAAETPPVQPKAPTPAVAPQKETMAAAPQTSPAQVATPTTAPPQAPAGEAPAAASSPANAVVALVDTTKVVPGDNLWDISTHFYGSGLRYTQIYAANSSQIRNPRLIYPGQIFVLPQLAPN